MFSIKAVCQRTLSKIAEEEPPNAPPTDSAVREVHQSTGDGRDQLRHCFVPADESGCLGLHLSRTPWDPYPWVSGIVNGSCADLAGVRVGDCVLEANGEDLLGLKVVDIAKRVRGRRISSTAPAGVALMLWNSGFEKNNLNPQSLSRFANCLQGIAGLLECPICLEIIRPPSWQCNHGHLICSGCRSKTTKCPICREVLGRGRCIVADKLFHYMVQTLGQEDEQQRQPVDPNAQISVNNSRRRPQLVLRQYQRHLQQQHSQQVHHQPHKHALKLKANIDRSGTSLSPLATPASMTSMAAGAEWERNFHCPTGQACVRMKSQHEILIHLQKSHQTSVVQYYVTPGDTVDVALMEGGSSLPCVVLLSSPSSGPTDCNAGARPPQPPIIRNQLFFLTKFRLPEQPGQVLYWMWHSEDSELRADRFQVQLLPGSGDDPQQSPNCPYWRGRPVPLSWSCQEVLGSNRYARISDDARQLRVRVLIGSDYCGRA